MAPHSADCATLFPFLLFFFFLSLAFYPLMKNTSSSLLTSPKNPVEEKKSPDSQHNTELIRLHLLPQNLLIETSIIHHHQRTQIKERERNTRATT
jgi:hypothetical protein